MTYKFGLGQELRRLGVKMVGTGRAQSIGKLSGPEEILVAQSLHP